MQKYAYVYVYINAYNQRFLLKFLHAAFLECKYQYQLFNVNSIFCLIGDFFKP